MLPRRRGSQHRFGAKHKKPGILRGKEGLRPPSEVGKNRPLVEDELSSVLRPRVEA